MQEMRIGSCVLGETQLRRVIARGHYFRFWSRRRDSPEGAGGISLRVLRGVLGRLQRRDSLRQRDVNL